MNTINTDLPEEERLPRAFGRLGFSGEQREQIELYCARVRESNEVLSLVSVGDCARLESIHVPDSLSLVPWVTRYGGNGAHVLDIGSGGGFPAIPVKIAAPSLEMTLVERSVKKAAFLGRVVDELELGEVGVVNGEFPVAGQGLKPDVITARAVERAEKLRRQILKFLPERGVFLSQMPQRLGPFPPAFHVEHVDDDWTVDGLRRGSLDIVRRR